LQHLKIFCLCIFVGSFVILYSSTLAFGESHLDTSVLFEKAKAAVKAGEYEKSIEYFDKILENEQSNIDALINKGAALIELEKYQEAILSFDKILEIDPNNFGALNNKGAALTRLENYEQAISSFDQILDINPMDATALKNRHIAFQEMGVKSIEDSKYSAHVQIQVRNSDGILVGVIEIKKVDHSPHPITDEFLENYPVKETFEKNGVFYVTREIVVSLNADEDYFISSNKLFSQKYGYPIIVFMILHHSFVVEKGDTAEAVWTITSIKNNN